MLKNRLVLRRMVQGAVHNGVRGRLLCRSLLVFAFAMCAMGFAHGQSEQGLLDAEEAFREARQAASDGDFNRAIASLERVLIARPGLSNIQFELGLLYSKVGAAKRAQYYLEESLKDPNMPSDVRERAETELAALTSDKRSKTRYGGSIGIGLQSDSNPASATDLSNLTNNEGGSPSQVSETEEQDFSARLSASVFANRQLGWRPGFEWRNRLSVYTERYVEQNELDETGYSARTGLRLPFRGKNKTTLAHTPYLSLSGNTESNNLSLGYGLQKFAETWRFNTGVSGGMVRYTDDGQAVRLDSERYTANFAYSFAVSVSNWVNWSVGFTRNDAKALDETFNARSISLGLTHRNRIAGKPVSVSGNVSRLSRDYEAADFVEGVSRSDTTRSAELAFSVGLTERWQGRLSATYLDNDSNVRRLRYDNTNFALNVTYRF